MNLRTHLIQELPTRWGLPVDRLARIPTTLATKAIQMVHAPERTVELRTNQFQDRASLPVSYHYLEARNSLRRQAEHGTWLIKPRMVAAQGYLKEAERLSEQSSFPDEPSRIAHQHEIARLYTLAQAERQAAQQIAQRLTVQMQDPQSDLGALVAHTKTLKELSADERSANPLRFLAQSIIDIACPDLELTGEKLQEIEQGVLAQDPLVLADMARKGHQVKVRNNPYEAIPQTPKKEPVFGLYNNKISAVGLKDSDSLVINDMLHQTALHEFCGHAVDDEYRLNPDEGPFLPNDDYLPPDDRGTCFTDHETFDAAVRKDLANLSPEVLTAYQEQILYGSTPEATTAKGRAEVACWILHHFLDCRESTAQEAQAFVRQFPETTAVISQRRQQIMERLQAEEEARQQQYQARQQAMESQWPEIIRKNRERYRQVRMQGDES